MAGIIFKLLKSSGKFTLNLFGANFSVGSFNQTQGGLREEILDFYSNKPIFKGEKINQLIGKKIEEGTPFLLGRWGTVEYGCLRHYLKKIPWWEKQYNKAVRTSARNNAGFFPNNEIYWFNCLGKEFLQATKSIDYFGILGMPDEEKIALEICPNAQLIKMKDVSPWWYDNPWSQKLEGKRVLVIHPFARDIEKQYSQKRQQLFKDPKILPKFQLKTIRAIQRRTPEQKQFNSWFEALWYMKGMIKATEFDIALIGCGAYGLPLASFVKEEMQKPAIHLGSEVQILFGLRGRRWDQGTRLKHLFNEHWIYPSDNIGDITGLGDTSVYSK